MYYSMSGTPNDPRKAAHRAYLVGNTTMATTTTRRDHRRAHPRPLQLTRAGHAGRRQGATTGVAHKRVASRHAGPPRPASCLASLSIMAGWLLPPLSACGSVSANLHLPTDAHSNA